MQKILFLLNRYPGFGGIENVTSMLANEFVHRGYNVSIFSCLSQENAELIVPLDPNIQVINVEQCVYKERIQRFKEIITNIDILIFQDSYAPIEFFLDYVDKSKTQVIIVEHNTPDCFLLSYCDALQKYKWYSIPGILRRAKFPYNYSKILFSIKRRHKFLIERADKYVLLSEEYKHIINKKLNIKNINNVYSIPNPVKSIEHISNSVLANKDKEALFVGRLTSQKGIKYLLEIWKKFSEKFHDVKLTIIGDGELREYVEDRIKKDGINNIFLEGFQTDTRKYYRRSSIFLMTSVYEGFALVLLEAMEAGVVPFAFDSFESLKDIINDAENGYIASPFDINEYVSKMVAFERMSEIEKLKIRYNAVEKVNKFSLDIIADKWIDLFNE